MMDTITVMAGNVTIGGDSPIVVQTMCNTHTSDVEASVAQCVRLHEAGAQMIRLTVPSPTQVESLREIKTILRDKGIDTPLVADVHFSSEIAIAAAEVVEKVRINPGNFHKDHEKAREQFARLVEVCKEHGTAIRIGLNHGSLGDRITNLYGNTPLAMKEAVMEWLDMCVENDFYNVVVSLKASNTYVMVEAYRLLSRAMQEKGVVFPLHLGVTEAGNGDAGRIKSAVGISALLSEGIGNTLILTFFALILGVVLGVLHVDFVGQSEVEELVCCVDKVCAPVAQCSHAEVVPTAPVTLVEEFAEVVVADAAVPCVVVHSFGDCIAVGHFGHVPVVLMPTAVVVHVCYDFCYVLDDACFHPCLELEVVGFGVSLVAYLCDDFGMAVCHFDEYFAFLEGADEGFFAIDVFAVLHGCHADYEVCVVGHADGYGVEVFAVFVEEFAEVGEAFCVGIHLECFLALFSLQVHVAECHDFHHVCSGKLVDILLASVTDADVCNLHFVAFCLFGFFACHGKNTAWVEGYTCCGKAYALQEISSC